MPEVKCNEDQSQSLANLASANSGDMRLLNECHAEAKEITERLVARTRATVGGIAKAHEEEIGDADKPTVNVDEETQLATLSW